MNYKKIIKLMDQAKKTAKLTYRGDELNYDDKMELIQSLWYRHTQVNQTIKDLYYKDYHGNTKEQIIQRLETSFEFEEAYIIEMKLAFNWDIKRIEAILSYYNTTVELSSVDAEYQVESGNYSHGIFLNGSIQDRVNDLTA